MTILLDEDFVSKYTFVLFGRNIFPEETDTNSDKNAGSIFLLNTFSLR